MSQRPRVHSTCHPLSFSSAPISRAQLFRFTFFRLVHFRVGVGRRWRLGDRPPSYPFVSSFDVQAVRVTPCDKEQVTLSGWVYCVRLWMDRGEWGTDFPNSMKNGLGFMCNGTGHPWRRKISKFRPWHAGNGGATWIPRQPGKSPKPKKGKGSKNLPAGSWTQENLIKMVQNQFSIEILF